MKIRKVVIYEPNCQLYFPSPLALILYPLWCHFSFLLVRCQNFIQPFSLPLFSTYITGESHREVKFLSEKKRWEKGLLLSLKGICFLCVSFQRCCFFWKTFSEYVMLITWVKIWWQQTSKRTFRCLFPLLNCQFLNSIINITDRCLLWDGLQ